MSRLRLRSFLCRIRGHRYDTWIQGEPYQWCVRCHRMHPASVALGRVLVDRTSPSPAPASSSSLQVELQKALDNLSRKAIERAARRDAASRPEWAPATVAAISPSPKAGDIESASAPSGVSR